MKKITLSCLVLLSFIFAYPQWTWQNPLPQGNDLHGIFFTDALTGYSVGKWGTIIKTTDGGNTWTLLYNLS